METRSSGERKGRRPSTIGQATWQSCPNVEVFYQVTTAYAPGYERGLRWDDPDLGVEWPAEVWSQGKASFLVCVFGEFSFGTSLAEISRGATAHDRRIEIRWVRKPQELSACQVLFVSRSEQKSYTQVLDPVRGQTVLTVGETPGFLDAGGILSFSGQQGTIQFDVNLEAANKAHLKISSRLLALARHVLNQTEAAKS